MLVIDCNHYKLLLAKNDSIWKNCWKKWEANLNQFTFMPCSSRVAYGLFTALCWILAWGHADAQSFQSTAFFEVDGLASNAVYDLSQSDEGPFIAITKKGISAYDGTSWTTFPDSLDLPTNRTCRLARGADGRVWLSGIKDKKGIIAVYADGTWHKKNSPPEEMHHAVVSSTGLEVSIQEDGSANLIFSNSSGVFTFEEASGQWNQLKLDALPQKTVIWDICIAAHGLYIVTDQGLWLKNQQGLTPVNLSTPNQRMLRMIHDQANDRFLLLGDAWLAEVRNNQTSMLIDHFTQAMYNKRSGNELLVMKSGKIIFGLNSRMRLYNPETGTVKDLDISGQIESFWHNHAFVDREENLWISTERGLVLIHNLRFQYYDHNHGFQTDEVCGTVNLDDTTLLVGGNRSIGVVTPNQSRTIYTPNAPSDHVFRFSNFQKDRHGAVYFSAYRDGIGRIDHNLEVSWIAPSPDSSGVSTIMILEDSMLVASNQQLYCWKKGKYRKIANGKHYIRQMKRIGDRIYQLSINGLFVVHPDGSRQLIKGENTQFNSMYCIEQYRGELLIGTMNGIGKVEGDRVVSYKNYDGQLVRPVFDLLTDQNDNLWAGTDFGVFIVNKDDQVRHYHRKNGLVGNDVNRGTMTEAKNGNIYIGTEHGLAVYLPNFDQPDQTVPPIPKILSLASQERSLSPLKTQYLSSSENALDVVFGGISFANNNSLEYRYRLQGLDSDWSYQAGSKRLVRSYSNLSGGNYQFQFQVRQPGGEWSSELKTAVIRVAPPYYFQWWFITILVIALILIGFLINRLYYNLQMKRLLEEKVDKHVEKIRESEDHLRTQNEELTKVNHELDAFVYRVAHDLRGPLMKLLGLVHLHQLESDSNPELSNHMENSVKQMDEFIKDLLNFSKNSRKDLEVSDVDFYQIINPIFQTFQGVDEQSHIDFKLEMNQEIPLKSDAFRLSIILQNLISNAVNYRDPAKKKPFVHVEVNTSEAETQITIQDNGLGIPHDHQKKIFEMFFRGTPKSTGSGLGLFIVTEVLQKLNGEISLTSEPTKGSTFTLTLPQLQAS